MFDALKHTCFGSEIVVLGNRYDLGALRELGLFLQEGAVLAAPLDQDSVTRFTNECPVPPPRSWQRGHQGSRRS